MSELVASTPSFRDSISRRSNSIRRSFSSASRRLSTSPRRNEKGLGLTPLASSGQNSVFGDIDPITFLFSKQLPAFRSQPRSASCSFSNVLPVDSVLIPRELLDGIELDRVTHKKRTVRTLQINKALLEISWDPKKSSSRFVIDDIMSIYSGSQASSYQNELTESLSDTDSLRWMTIVYVYERKKIRELHIIAKSDLHFQLLNSTLLALWALRESSASLIQLPSHIIESQWSYLKVPEITFDQALDLLVWHNIVIPPDQIEKLYKTINGGREMVNCSDFINLVSALSRRDDIEKVYNKVLLGEHKISEKPISNEKKPSPRDVFGEKRPSLPEISSEKKPSISSSPDEKKFVSMVLDDPPHVGMVAAPTKPVTPQVHIEKQTKVKEVCINQNFPAEVIPGERKFSSMVLDDDPHLNEAPVTTRSTSIAQSEVMLANQAPGEARLVNQIKVETTTKNEAPEELIPPDKVCNKPNTLIHQSSTTKTSITNSSNKQDPVFHDVFSSDSPVINAVTEERKFVSMVLDDSKPVVKASIENLVPANDTCNKNASISVIPPEGMLSRDDIQRKIEPSPNDNEEGKTNKAYENSEERHPSIQLSHSDENMVSIIHSEKISLIDEPAAEMTFEQFFEFCRNNQKIDDDGAIRTLFDKYGQKTVINRQGFVQYLMSDDNGLIKQQNVELDEPLTRYFISSSHNTYLPNRQVLDDSSVEPYIKQLLHNCRCVEIDVWDGDNMPMVGHGVYVSGSVHVFMTKEIKLTTVLLAINRFAFETSDLPVILSFEIRCNLDNQRRVAQILTRIFGDKLVNREIGDKTPQLGQLKNKILVKVKTTTEDAGVGVMAEKSKFKKANVIVKELGSLGVYLKGMKFKAFDNPMSQIPHHCFSFSETKINKLINLGAEEEEAFVKHNVDHFTRVYPDKKRVRSTNFDPIPYWKRGVQMVALNWQADGLNSQINEAMFAGSLGYLKKPEHSASLREALKQKVRHKIGIEILGLWNLPEHADSFNKDYSVSIEIYGVSERKELLKSHYYNVLSKTSNDTVSKHEKVWTVKKMRRSEENGLVQLPVNYNFNKPYNRFESGEIRSKDWEYTFLRFTVKAEDKKKPADEEDENEEVIGQYIVRASSLNEGYRHVPLKDHELQYKHARIFVNVVKTRR